MKHLPLIIIVTFSIIMAYLQAPGIVSQPDDHRYVYVTDDGERAWICKMTEASDSCYPIDSKVGGYR